MFSAELFNLLKLTLADQTLKSKILYGSDFYMVEQQTNERQFVTNIRGCVGEENFKWIAEQNPAFFLHKLI